MREETFQHEVLWRLTQIERLLAIKRFTLILEHDMAIGNIAAGASGTFTPQILLNGEPYTPPSGSTFVPSYTYSSPTPDAELAPSADTSDVVVTIPATSEDTSLTVGVSVIAPDGTTLSATDTVTVTPAPPPPPPQVFTLSLTQTA
jgi:hypothetical protein